MHTDSARAALLLAFTVLAMLVLAPSALAATSYHINSAPDQALVPVSAGAQTLMGGAVDDDYALVDLPFTVYAYGNTYTQISPSSNGTVVYGPEGSGQYAIDDDTDFPGPTLLAFGADLTTPHSGRGILGEVGGDVGSRTYTVEWNVDEYPDFYTLPETARLQAVFHENSHRVDTYYSGTIGRSGWIGMKLTPQDFTRFGASTVPYPSAGTHLVFTILSIETPGSPSNDDTPVVTGSGDNAAGAGDITVEIFDGDAAVGTPIQTQTVPYDPATGAYATDAFTTLVDGTYTIAAHQTDGAGQLTTTVTPLVIDTVAPQTTLTTTPQDPTNATEATFEFSSNEAGTFECAVDAQPFAACTSPEAYSGLAEGGHALEVRAIDRAGNVDQTPDSVSWVVDTTAPTTTITSGPADGATTAQSTPGFAFSSSEKDSTFACRLDDGGTFACESPYTTSALGDGPHTFAVTATDAAGNVEPTSVSRTFTIDTTAQTTIDSGPANDTTTSDSTPVFAFSSGETGSTFACSIDGGEPFACVSPLTLDELAEGPHTLAVTATDALNNADPTPASRTFTVDATAPQTTIGSGPANDSTTADSTPEFAFSSSEAGSTFACQIDTAEFAPCSSGLSTAVLSDGEHTFAVRATDGADNEDASPATRTFTVDTDAPQTTIDSGPASGATTADSTPTIAFSSSEPDSTFACSIDGGGTFTCESPFTPSVLADGEHTLAVATTDAVGNVDQTPASRAFVVDASAPQTTIDSGPAAGSHTADSTPVFAFSSAETGSTFACSIDGGGTFACESPFTPTALADGEHAFAVTATDVAGNEDASPASRAFSVDTTGPLTTFDDGPAEHAQTSDSTPAFAFSSSEAASTFECSIDGGAVFACESPLTPDALADGEHTLAVTATDGLGNTEGAPAVRTFIVDTTAPQTSVADGPQDGATTGDSTPAFAFSSSEVGSTFECSIDGGADFACESSFTPAALADGQHTFSVTATDRSGNRDASPSIRRFTVDTRPAPVAASVAPRSPEPAAATAAPAPAKLLACVSRRRFSIRLRPARVHLVSAVVRVNHKRVATRRRSGRLRATVDLRGLAKATYAVTIDARDGRGRHYRETRRYRVC